MEHSHRPFAPSKTGDRPRPEKPQQHHRKTSSPPAQRISPDTPIVYRLIARRPEITAQDPDVDIKGLRGGQPQRPHLPAWRSRDRRVSGTLRRMRFAQGLLEIVDQILYILDADRQAQQVQRHR